MIPGSKDHYIGGIGVGQKEKRKSTAV